MQKMLLSTLGELLGKAKKDLQKHRDYHPVDQEKNFHRYKEESLARRIAVIEETLSLVEEWDVVKILTHPGLYEIKAILVEENVGGENWWRVSEEEAFDQYLRRRDAAIEKRKEMAALKRRLRELEE